MIQFDLKARVGVIALRIVGNMVGTIARLDGDYDDNNEGQRSRRNGCQ